MFNNIFIYVKHISSIFFIKTSWNIRISYMTLTSIIILGLLEITRATNDASNAITQCSPDDYICQLTQLKAASDWNPIGEVSLKNTWRLRVDELLDPPTKSKRAAPEDPGNFKVSASNMIEGLVLKQISEFNGAPPGFTGSVEDGLRGSMSQFYLQKPVITKRKTYSGVKPTFKMHMLNPQRPVNNLKNSGSFIDPVYQLYFDSENNDDDEGLIVYNVPVPVREHVGSTATEPNKESTLESPEEAVEELAVLTAETTQSMKYMSETILASTKASSKASTKASTKETTTTASLTATSAPTTVTVEVAYNSHSENSSKEEEPKREGKITVNEGGKENENENEDEDEDEDVDEDEDEDENEDEDVDTVKYAMVHTVYVSAPAKEFQVQTVANPPSEPSLLITTGTGVALPTSLFTTTSPSPVFSRIRKKLNINAVYKNTTTSSVAAPTAACTNRNGTYSGSSPPHSSLPRHANVGAPGTKPSVLACGMALAAAAYLYV